MSVDTPMCQGCNIAMAEMTDGLTLCPKCGVGLAESFQAIIDYMNPGGDGLQCFDLSEIEDHKPDEERMKFLASLGCPFELHVVTPCDRVVQGYDSEEVRRGLW